MLGNKNSRNSEIYINLERTIFQEGKDEFHVKTAKNADEASKLLEVGFKYVCSTPEDLMLLRKRK